MVLYRSLPNDVYLGQRRIQIFTAATTRAEGVTIAEVAEQEGCSEELIYCYRAGYLMGL